MHVGMTLLFLDRVDGAWMISSVWYIGQARWGCLIATGIGIRPVMVNQPTLLCVRMHKHNLPAQQRCVLFCVCCACVYDM